MDFGLLLMIVGLVVIIASFFAKDASKKLAQDVEDLSINIYEETNRLTKRMKALEEELMVDVALPTPKKHESFTQAASSAPSTQPQPAMKPVNPIIVSQVLALQKQGMSVADISVRSNLSQAEVISVIAQNGGLSS